MSKHWTNIDFYLCLLHCTALHESLLSCMIEIQDLGTNFDFGKVSNNGKRSMWLAGSVGELWGEEGIRSGFSCPTLSQWEYVRVSHARPLVLEIHSGFSCPTQSIRDGLLVFSSI